MGSLFAGIGGFEQAGRRNGIETIWNCEIDPYKQQILKKHFPHAHQYADIHDVHNPPYVDILCGGWPCQDNSRAKQYGKGQLGLEGARSGLYLEFCRLIREIRPVLALGENVADILTINGGRDFNRILSELAAIGYNASWCTVRASDIGAPFHRARVYMAAYPDSVRFPSLVSLWENVRETLVTRPRELARATVSTGGRWSEAAPGILRMDDGVPSRLDIPRIHGCGDAVVVDVAVAILGSLIDHWPDNN